MSTSCWYRVPATGTFWPAKCALSPLNDAPILSLPNLCCLKAFPAFVSFQTSLSMKSHECCYAGSRNMSA
eukprot:1147499-Pelagomonas_calceolata.AAC.14